MASRLLLAQLGALLAALAVTAPALAWHFYLVRTLPALEVFTDEIAPADVPLAGGARPCSAHRGAARTRCAAPPTLLAGMVSAAIDGAPIGGVTPSDQSRRASEAGGYPTPGARHWEGR